MSAIPPTFSHIECKACGHRMPAALLTSSCGACGNTWLDARYDYSQIDPDRWQAAVSQRDASLWRYEELLPLSPAFRVSMDEGWTPLLPATRLGRALGHGRIFMKDERQGPTSSFKDRQASLAVSALNAEGIDEVVIASTGNAAAAYAAYCARAGIKLWVFVTSLVPVEKMRETALYGAEVIKVTGTYDQAKDVAADFAERRGLHMERGAKAVVGKESMKTIAFEIAERLGRNARSGKWDAPDWYVQAVSGGIGPVGVWKGFEELKALGVIDKLPRMAIIQIEGCSPMVQAFKADSPTATAVIPRTNITVLSTGDPGPGYTYLYHAVKSNAGTMAAVSEDEAFRSMRRLAALEGVSVEPATAVAFAGLEKLIADGVIGPEETVVVNASGHTMPVEKFILTEHHQPVDIQVESSLAQRWGLPEEGLGAAIEHLDEKVKTVVVIDDSARDSRLIRRLLQRQKSYRVYEANDPFEALEIVRQRRPDLVVTDLKMPGMDGFDIIETLKKDPDTADIPVMVVSGKSLSEEEERFLEQAEVSHWVKGEYNVHNLVEHIVQQVENAEDALTGATHAPTSSSPSYTVLIVEDNPLDGRLLRRTLEQQAMFDVIEADSGEQALLKLKEGLPNMVILDLILPDMSGLELIDYIRHNPDTSDTPIMVITAKELTSDEEALLAKHVTHTWRKAELDRELLQKQVQKMLTHD